MAEAKAAKIMDESRFPQLAALRALALVSEQRRGTDRSSDRLAKLL